jgi:trk system potassium uptake protein
MFVVIVGGGKVGSHLSKMLVSQGYEVTLIEIDPDKCYELSDTLDGVNTICGDGDEPYVLDEANVRTANAVVAATGDDEDNLVVCLLGKIEYQVPVTIARINNPANEWLFNETFGVDMMVSNTQMMAELLNKCVLGVPAEAS